MELKVAEMLRGETKDLEPVCPFCKHVGAVRIEVHANTGEKVEVPCYLTWCGAHGVTAAARDYKDMPKSEYIQATDGKGGVVSAWSIYGVKCGNPECAYISAPSAFCRPIGPTYRK